MKKAKQILLLFSIASCLTLLNGAQRALISLAEGEPSVPLWRILFADAVHWYIWCLAVFPIFILARRIPLKRSKYVTVLFAHLIIGFLFALANIVLQSVVVSFFYDDSFRTIMKTAFVAKLFVRTSLYFLIAIGCYVLIFYRRKQEEEFRARDLETRLAMMQFQVLKSKLNPEFLFHSLRSISALMRTDIEAADLLTARLGDFLRLSLENSGATRVPLHDEIELVKSYVEMQRIDHGKISVRFHIDPHVIGTPVPNRVLLDAIQTFEVQGSLEVHVAPQDDDSVKISITGLKANAEQLSPWVVEAERLSLTLASAPQTEAEESKEETFFESLQDFRRSLALKEEGIKSSRPSVARRVWGTLAVWTLAGSFFLVRELLSRSSAGEPLNVLQNIKESAAWYWWAIFTPFIFYLAKKYPLQPGNLRKSIPAHIFFCFLVGFSMVFVWFAQLWAIGADTSFAMFQETLLRYSYLFDALTYWGIVGVHEGLRSRWEYLQQDIRTARLKGNLMEAQVQALKMQLHPHFLFNTLNSIAELMHEDLEATEIMIKRLENFLRLTFENSDVTEITLQHELDFLRNYLEIQQVRFQDRLKVEIEIDPQTMKDRVPNLILQPIVENAIRHGVSPRMDSGRVEIRAFHQNGTLLLEVEDDGPGLSTQSFREGVGMSNTRRRLEQMYGKECGFRVLNNPHGGLIVTLQLPARQEAIWLK